MLAIDLVWIARTADIAPNAPQVFSWSYVKDNVRFVIETRGLGTTFSEVLRVYHRSQILYDIPIQDLIEEGKHLWSSLRHAGAEARAEQLPISGKAKYPSIALRYVLPVEGKIRRLQFKFTSPSNYNQAFSHLQELGLHIETVSSNGHPRSERLSCPPSQLSESSRRPSTAISPRFPVQIQLQEAVVTRPLSAQPMATSLATKFRPSSPLRSSFTASSVSMEDGAFPGLGGNHRPSSAARPDTPALLFDQASELPPRRELPFQRSESSPKSRGSETSRASSHNLPPLPKPTILNNIPPLVKPTGSININTSPKKSSANKGSNDRGTGPRSRASSTVLNEQDGLMFSNSRIPRPPSSSSAVHDCPTSIIAEQPHSLESQDRLPTPLTSDSTELRKFESSVTNGSNINQRNISLAEYASQTYDDRTNVLNQALLQYLENPDFLTLLGDIETAWVRIASGHG